MRLTAQLRHRSHRLDLFVPTKRDVSILMNLYEHRVLTTSQLCQLHFTNIRITRRRLLHLFRNGLVTRFRPHADRGSLPYHYVLDELGARIVGARKEIDFERLHFRKDRALTLLNSPRLTHKVETNDFMCSLVYACRQDGRYRLRVWWGESRCVAAWGGLVRPDGFAILEGPGQRKSFFLELDRGTESDRRRLEEKIRDYQNVAASPDCADSLLFCFPTEKRERFAREALVGSGVPVATATRDRHHGEPLGNNWLLIGGSDRVSILSLPDRRGRS